MESEISSDHLADEQGIPLCLAGLVVVATMGALDKWTPGNTQHRDRFIESAITACAQSSECDGLDEWQRWPPPPQMSNRLT